MNDMDMYIAKTQARLAFFLITILVVLTLGVGLVLLVAQHIDQTISGLITQVVTGVLALCGIAVGYFFARHRPPTKADEGFDTSTPTGGGVAAPLAPPSNNQEKGK
jgi:hypothetical protein